MVHHGRNRRSCLCGTALRTRIRRLRSGARRRRPSAVRREGLTRPGVRAPKPPSFAGARHSVATKPAPGENLGRPSETDLRHRFVGPFEESSRRSPGRAAKVCQHPFEEIYCITSGEKRGTLDGKEEVIETGDLVWAGRKGTHGFVNERDRSARWIEVQSPPPPTSDGYFVPDDWRKLLDEH
ncbi:cupin domain-containing protein [Streptomyces sp. NPDC059861]|uniref:cupin domain-containing protein n=1 Tax=Streptomyces sp. NPDC059861 TaxID=3346974 RepID=UPI003649C45E